jgi:uncharacterized ubiquitin-like protein YukD
MIEVTLEFAGKQLDLLVPSGVTFDRLSQLVRDGFAAKGTALPDVFAVAPADKALVVSGHDYLSSFGIGNGDRLQIDD